MMDIQSPTCFRNTAALPRNSSSGALTLTSQISNRSDSAKYVFNRSNSYTGSMVVESQTHNFRPMTPDPHPDSGAEKLSLQSPGRKRTLMPPEGAVTPTDEPVIKKSNISENFADDITNDSLASKLNGQHFTDQIGENSQNESVDSIDMAQFHTKQRRFSDSVTIKNAESYLDEAAIKAGLDKSPSNLSPRTMSDTDFDGTSTGSPSVSLSGERRRRKPNIEDIVRRMKEDDYYSEESENEEVFNEEGIDEVDGDIDIKMPMVANQMNEAMLKTKFLESRDGKNESELNRSLECKLNENNNVIEKGQQEDFDQQSKVGDEENTDKDGIPLPASSKPENIKGESVIKQVGHVTPPHSGSNWLGSPFNVFPNFPFQPGPPEPPFSKFMNPFENKFNSPDCEKDYLKCQYCERTFRRQKNLENHVENTHHGKSPVRKKSGENGDMYFKCNHCPYTTKHQSNLYVHLRIHTGERPYICGACGVQYSQSHSLKSHIINKHDAIMSYYIKEKRTRSPRGLGYLATQPVPGESPVFKMPAAPMLPQQFPNSPNGLHFPQVSLPQSMPLKHSPQPKLNTSNNTPSSVPNSPLMSPSSIQGQQVQQLSPNNQPPPQMSPQQHLLRPQFAPFHPEGMELAKLGLMNFPFYGRPAFAGKPSPPFPINGHSPVSPQFNNGMTQHLRQQQLTEQAITASGGNPQQFNKPPPEMNGNRHSDDDGAIDLSKKSKEGALNLAITDKKVRCSDECMKCTDCLHLLKLKMLRMNVVRMLSILVPNLNFEEKGINAEGDSVDDLLRDVIESNIHDEEPNE